MALTDRRSNSAEAAAVVLRIGVVTTMGAALAVIAGAIFDELQPALFIPPVTVGLAAVLTRSAGRGWRIATAIATVAASAVVVALAVDGDIGDALRAVVNGPRRLLTTEWPSPVEPSVITAVGIVLGLSTAVAADLARRRRWRFAPLIPLAVGAVALIALGAPARPSWLVIAALGAGASLIGLFPVGEDVRARSTALLGDRTLAVTATAVAVVAVGASVAVAGSDRADPRQVEDAELSSTLLDPIEAAVALRAADPAFDLFEITDRSTLAGRALPIRWRIAALDVYDGQRWVPRVTLRSIGGRLGTAPPLEPGDTPPITFDVAYRSDDIDLVPFPGRPLSVDVPVETDLERVAVRLSTPPVPGTTVSATSEVAPTLADIPPDATNPFVARPIDEIAQTFSDRARELVDDTEGDVLQQLRAIELTMRNDWVVDRDAPGGGQQLALLERFVTDTQRGTQEQFVSAFVLLARSLGVDARIATGFELPPDSIVSPLVIESSDAAVWPEVRLDPESARGGWLAFDPVPPFEETVEDAPQPPPDAQSPAAAQPPIPPPVDETDDDDDRDLVTTEDGGRWGAVAAWAVRVAAVTSIGLLPIAIAVGTILFAKWRRRRIRLRHPDPAHRVRGAWANVTDSLIDAGLTVGPAWTDDRIAVGGASLAPSVPHELRRLAAMATAMTFGPRDHAARLVDDATATSRSIDAALRAERSRWKRITWRLSLRSFRGRSRSPVVA